MHTFTHTCIHAIYIHHHHVFVILYACECVVAET